MSYEIFQLPKQVLLAGAVVKPSWKVSFFLSGLTTPTPVYSDSALTTPMTQPVQADISGTMPVIYLDPGVAYKAIIYDQFDVQQGGAVDPVNDKPFENLTQTIFDDFLDASLASDPRQHRGEFTLPATARFFGDSFWEQPNAHTSSGDSMAYKAAVLLGVGASINATSGNTSADKQDAIFAVNPAVTDCWMTNLGQNDAQFIGTGSDIEMRLNDTALIQLANIFQMAVPSGATRYLASSFVQAGTWTSDSDIAEGGALKSSTITDTLQVTVADSRYIVVIFKMKTGNAGKFKVVIDGTTYTGGLDATGFHSYPFANLPTNTAKTFARCALVFDTGRRKPQTVVQMQVTSATGAGNVVTICSVMGLSGAPLAGPLVGACDLTDREAAGYATAAGSQISLPKVSRLIDQCLAIAGACGLRVLPLPVAAAINNTTHLDADQFHPNETGATLGAAAIATAIQNAARDWSVSRPDLNAQAFLLGADGYVLMAGRALVLGEDLKWKRQKLSPRQLNMNATDPILCPDSIRICFDDGSGTFDLAASLYLSRETGTAGIAYTGNLGATGPYNLVAFGASRVQLTDVTMFPVTTGAVDLGKAANAYGYGFFSKALVTLPVAAASLPAAATAGAGARAAVNNATQTLTAGIGAVVAGGGANTVPVFSDGANWRIG